MELIEEYGKITAVYSSERDYIIPIEKFSCKFTDGKISALLQDQTIIEMSVKLRAPTHAFLACFFSALFACAVLVLETPIAISVSLMYLLCRILYLAACDVENRVRVAWFIRSASGVVPSAALSDALLSLKFFPCVI